MSNALAMIIRCGARQQAAGAALGDLRDVTSGEHAPAQTPDFLQVSDTGRSDVQPLTSAEGMYG